MSCVEKKYAGYREVVNQTPRALDPVGNKSQYPINEKLFWSQKRGKSLIPAWNRISDGTACRTVTVRKEIQKCKIKYPLL